MNQTSQTAVVSYSTTKKLVFSAMAIALATVTSYIKVFELPMGGSVTLCSMLFISLIGYWFGPKAGILTGIAHGILQFILEPYILSIPQVVIDYFFAFGALGCSGFFRNQKQGLILGYIAAVLGRYFFAVLSGVVFFASAAPESMHPLVYSIIYNGSYLGLEAIITIILLTLPPVRQAITKLKAI